jgi:hypothetical protein
MYRRRPSAALVPSRASLPRTSWVELKLRDNIRRNSINKYNKILVESNTNICLEDTRPKNRSTNRPGLAVSSIKAVLLSESIRNKTRIRSYVELTTS